MRKIISLFIAVMLVFSITACTSSTENTTPTDVQETTETTIVTTKSTVTENKYPKEVESILNRDIFIFKKDFPQLYTASIYDMDKTVAYVENWKLKDVLNEKNFQNIEWKVFKEDNLASFSGETYNTSFLIQFFIDSDAKPLALSLYTYSKKDQSSTELSVQRFMEMGLDYEFALISADAAISVMLTTSSEEGAALASDNNSNNVNALKGVCQFTGILKIDGLNGYLELPKAISYDSDFGTITDSKILLSEEDVLKFKEYNGLTVTLEGELFDYRGTDLMFVDTPILINSSGVPSTSNEHSYYPNWESTDNETKFWDATEVLRTIIYRCDGVWDVRTLGDGDVLYEISVNGFLDYVPVQLSINDSWIENHGYGYKAYVLPEKEHVKIMIRNDDAPVAPIWIYSWDGELISGNTTLEEYILSQGFIN